MRPRRPLYDESKIEEAVLVLLGALEFENGAGLELLRLLCHGRTPCAGLISDPRGARGVFFPDERGHAPRQGARCSAVRHKRVSQAVGRTDGPLRGGGWRFARGGDGSIPGIYDCRIPSSTRSGRAPGLQQAGPLSRRT